MKPFTTSAVFGLLLAGAQARPQYGATSSSESSLVADIISQLTPFVTSTVNEALAARSPAPVAVPAVPVYQETSFSSGSAFGSSSASSAAAASSHHDDGEHFEEHPKYTYAYQVATDETQTYITQTENKDGDKVNGEYSYVDANGALVTVKYQADDVNGYTETRSEQPGFVQMRVYKAPESKVAPAPVKAKPAPRPAPRPSGNGDLVAKIISQLTPYIKSTVSESLSARQTAPAPVYSAVPAAPVASSASSSLDSTFGVGGTNNIQVETPVYQFDAEF